MSSIFSKIIAGKIPCYKVAETENCFAFLDIHPLKKGHTLVIPKIEIDYIFNLPDDVLSDLNLFAKKVALGIDSVVSCNRVAVVVLGLEVPHAHIHLIPIDSESDIRFSNKRVTMSESEFSELATQLSTAIELD